MARRRLSPYSLAEKLDHKDLKKVKRWLFGDKTPNSNELKTISKILEWPIDFFFNGNIVWGEEMWVSGHVIRAPYWALGHRQRKINYK